MGVNPGDFQIDELRRFGEQALAEEFARHQDRLERIIDLRLDPRLSGRVDAADVVQEAFIEARKRLSRFLENPTVSILVWLRGVALDTLIHVHRRHLAKIRNAGREVSIHRSMLPQVSSLSMASHLVGDLTSPSQAAIRQETVQRVEEALEGMDSVDKEILILRHFEQLSNNEAASVVGVKKAAASRRYMRALKRFREAMEAMPGFPV